MSISTMTSAAGNIPSTKHPYGRRRLSIRISTIVLLCVFLSLFALLLALSDALETAHRDWTIQYFSSDGAVYFAAYEDIFANSEIFENSRILLTGTPIVLMKLAGGNLLLILATNLFLMLTTLKVALDCFDTRGTRLTFLIGALLFPYFLFGFLSLNKEIYAMCSAIFFASYWLRGKRSHLLAALLIAFAARYYMLLALVFLLFVFPSGAKPRYWLAVSTLLFISVVAPFLKTRIPGYSSEGLLQGAGVTQIVFSTAIDSYGYALVYPIKYITLAPTRIYSVIIGLGRPADPMEAVVSLLTTGLLCVAAYVIVFKRSISALPKRLALMALISPIPIMWTEIGHWRYFSYVYFFLLFSAVLFLSERQDLRKLRATS